MKTSKLYGNEKLNLLGERVLTCVSRLAEKPNDIFKHIVESELEEIRLFKQEEFDEKDIYNYIIDRLENHDKVVNGFKKYWINQLKKHVKDLDLIKAYGWLNGLKITLNDGNYFYLYRNGSIEIPLKNVSDNMIEELFILQGVDIGIGDMEQVPSVIMLNIIPEVDIWEVIKYKF